MKTVWGERLTTVFVRQGHYAARRRPALRDTRPPTSAIERIGDLLDHDSADAVRIVRRLRAR